jgi:hypothetical protein
MTAIAARILSPRKVNQSDSASLTRLSIAVVNAAVAIAKASRCFPCLAAEELAECGRVCHADVSRDGCAGEGGVH